MQQFKAGRLCRGEGGLGVQGQQPPHGDVEVLALDHIITNNVLKMAHSTGIVIGSVQGSVSRSNDQLAKRQQPFKKLLRIWCRWSGPRDDRAVQYQDKTGISECNQPTISINWAGKGWKFYTGS
eukprot:m.83993 g.83993  ORF g.83993 m.83993 type:complete len:124 (-) comp19677_c0_seq2:1155-1526(-)